MKDRSRSGAAALIFTLALVAIPSTRAFAQVRTPTHVACVGDSITYGYLASSSSKSYPSDLQAMFGSGVRVMNFGHNGATMLSAGDTPYINQSEYTAATSFVSGAGASAVVDVIIMLGTNDSKSQNWAPQAGSTRAQQFMTDCAALVDHFANLPTRPVVYLAIPAAIYNNTFGISESVTSNEIAPIIRQVAAQKGAPLIDIHTPTAGHPEYFSDGVHPTDAGYMLVAQLMHDGLLRPLTGAGGTGGGAGGAGGAGGGGAGRGGAGGTGGSGGAGSMGGRGGSGGAGTGGAGARGGNGGAGTGGAGTGGSGGSTAGTGGAASTAGTGGAATGTGGTGAGGTGTGAGGTGTGGSAMGAAGGGGSASGGTGGAGMNAGDDGGCACRLGAAPGSGGLIAVGFALIALAIRRRRG